MRIQELQTRLHQEDPGRMRIQELQAGAHQEDPSRIRIQGEQLLQETEADVGSLAQAR